MTREPTIPDDVSPRTSDLTVVQALGATRDTARRRADEEGKEGDQRWASIADRADRVLAVLGLESTEAGHSPAIGFDRVDRAALDLDTEGAERLTASLLALQDRPDGTRLDAADASLAELEDRIS
jgi:hypothetical protein